ncbi:MAG: hypothetical protein A3F12_00200, partial [Gammaproteobacteria bacterium RIFCSPHIGHO2_12_FULL_38_14]
FIMQDLKKKMVFVGGPRQVGKTALSHHIAVSYQRSQYLNADLARDRRSIMKHQWDEAADLVIFDELHKLSRWKRWIKGVYDTRPPHQQYFVTGSARLDVYRRGGDSLLGRYHYWRLHPFTLDELPSDILPKDAYQRLMTVGGFPEPFLTNDLRQAKRWREERFDHIIREDLRDLERVRDVALVEWFAEALRERAGSTISLNNLATDLEISPKTAKSWLILLERMYLVFPVYPLTLKMTRGIHKPVKVYFYDNADCKEDESIRLENLVATHLLKRLQFREDYFGERCSLHYIRDRDGREVDFVTVIDRKIVELIEVKLSDSEISRSLKYYKNMLKPQKTVQLVANLDRAYTKDEIQVITPITFFQKPPWEIALNAR